METTPRPIDAIQERAPEAACGGPGSAGRAVRESRPGAAPISARLSLAGVRLQRYRSAIIVYLGTRVLLLAVALAQELLRHHSFTHQLANWDGLWYRQLAHHGYPDRVLHAQSTLGFFPLYPLLIRLLAFLFPWWSTITAITIAGVVVSGVGGLVATILVQRLAAGWWGEAAGRRAAMFFCVFPGSVVFSMVYAEGILIPLAAACILALERRRWLAAGLLAALATAAEPEALVLVVVCAASALGQLRRHGWHAPQARASLLAPMLSVTGVGAFALYLWARTGTPFATMLAQRYGWNEKSDPFALVHLARSLAHEISFRHFNHPTINLNLVVGLLGAVLLLGLLVLLWSHRRTVSVEAILWTLGVSLLAVTSEYTPPNPRLMITAFPAVLVAGRKLEGRAFWWLICSATGLLAAMSALTFVGTTLRP